MPFMIFMVPVVFERYRLPPLLALRVASAVASSIPAESDAIAAERSAPVILSISGSRRTEIALVYVFPFAVIVTR